MFIIELELELDVYIQFYTCICYYIRMIGIVFVFVFEFTFYFFDFKFDIFLFWFVCVFEYIVKDFFIPFFKKMFYYYYYYYCDCFELSNSRRNFEKWCRTFVENVKLGVKYFWKQLHDFGTSKGVYEKIKIWN